ncbi:hypothetical protein ONE63_003836 [Megalurothrips usitatus]|uniref:Aminopeptidase N-like n=1 Tax=Megalurothrips usitatus TaxID=439358 RepID=A0AAV7X866_9NEOP|nr:hypothetical protein ONE63_003836 [Megalurothrips usitatus]
MYRVTLPYHTPTRRSADSKKAIELGLHYFVQECGKRPRHEARPRPRLPRGGGDSLHPIHHIRIAFAISGLRESRLPDGSGRASSGPRQHRAPVIGGVGRPARHACARGSAAYPAGVRHRPSFILFLCAAPQIPVDSVTEIGNEEVQLKLRGALIAGSSYNVTLTATGQFGNASDPGLVRAAFRDGGSDSWLAAIRGAPASARRVFPCIDGPAQVADVTLTVSRPSTHSAVSNTHVVHSEQVAGGAVTRDTFAPARLTPGQVGLVLAPLQRPELSAGVSVWARALAAADVADVKKYATDVSDAVGQLTGLPAAGLAVVALPGAEAAPTAGLAALNEDAVLYTGAASSSQRDALLELAEAVAQPGVRAEARPEHWGDAWVLRGLGAHVTGAAWRLGEQQGVLQLEEVLEAGARTTAAALPPSTDDAARCSRAAVDKGAVLVRMLENAFQAAVFDDAVRRFYQLSAKKAVGLDDLIDAFENATDANDDSDLPTGVTTAGVLLSWTSKPGYPVVTVIRDYENNNMTVSQKKFSWSGSTPSTGASDEWWLPLSYTHAQETPPSAAFREWLVPGENDMEVAIDHMTKYDWVYFNLRQLAPFRVNYDENNWQLLVQELSGAKFDEKLEPAARAQLIGDALALARAGELDYNLALDLASYLHQEDDVLPWLAARRAFAYLEGVLDDEALAWLNAFEALLLKDVYLDGHFEMDGADPPPGVALLRELTATWACAVGYTKCLEHADEAYVKWRGQGEAPKPDLEEAVLCRAVAKSDHSLDAINQTLVALGGLVGGRRRSYVRAAACGTAYLGR